MEGKDARIAELENVLVDVKWCMQAGPSCQVGLTERCKCAKCVTARIDTALAAQQQAESFDAEPFTSKEVDAIIEALEPATHSEDGGEVVEVVEVVGYRYCASAGYPNVKKWHFQETFPSFDSRKVREMGACDKLMTVAQHSRIVAALEAEIARLRKESGK